MYTIFINGFEATRKNSREEAIVEMRMLHESLGKDAVIYAERNGHVFQIEDLVAFGVLETLGL